MAKAKTQEPTHAKDAIIQAALILAAEQGWSNLSMHTIAVHADVSMDMMIALFDDKADILNAIGKHVDRQVAESLGAGVSEEEPERDRLFDVLMERFDILNENRAAFISIVDGTTRDPKQAVTAMPWLCQSMGRMLELAKIESHGWQGAIRIMGLSGVYLKVMRDWIKDDSPDMAATMAALDKALAQVDRWADRLGM